MIDVEVVARQQVFDPVLHDLLLGALWFVTIGDLNEVEAALQRAGQSR